MNGKISEYAFAVFVLSASFTLASFGVAMLVMAYKDWRDKE